MTRSNVRQEKAQAASSINNIMVQEERRVGAVKDWLLLMLSETGSVDAVRDRLLLKWTKRCWQRLAQQKPFLRTKKRTLGWRGASRKANGGSKAGATSINSAEVTTSTGMRGLCNRILQKRALRITKTLLMVVCSHMPAILRILKRTRCLRARQA